MSEITPFLENLGHWDWFIAGFGLAILEVFAPGAVFLWLGVAAAAVGFVVLAVDDLEWRYQFLLFAVLSVISIVASRRYLQRHPIETDRPELNRRGYQYVGRRFTLADAIIDGRGRLKVDDTMWKIEGPDAASGTHVRVTDVDGVVLKVEPDGDAESD